MEKNFDQICYEQFRLETFKNSPFEKNRNKCTSKKMADAGFYLTPTDKHNDKVTCYACGLEISDWKKTTDDPWVQHQNLKPDCLYVKTKQTPKHDLTVYEFLLIEKYRFHRINASEYQKKKSLIESSIKKVTEGSLSPDDIIQELKAIKQKI